jgi:RND family efflux transporter MFP subunit
LAIVDSIGNLSLSSCGLLKTPPEEPAIRPVRAMKVGDAAGLSGRSFPGRAKATQEVNLSFRVSGPLISLPIKVGDRVKKGDVLAQIDPRDFEVKLNSCDAQLATSQANLKAMKAGARPEELEQLRAATQRAEATYKRWEFELDRIQRLAKADAGSPVELERTIESKELAKAELRRAREELRIGETGARPEDIEAKEAEIKSLQAAVQAARDELDYTYLRAPFDGEVAAKYVENFETVQAKQPILRLLDTSKIEMVVDVPEDKISLVPLVKETICVFDAFPNVEITARIKEIGTEASDTTRTYPVTLIMEQPDGVKILPGMAGSVRGQVQMSEALAKTGLEVPESAVLAGEDGKQYVWTIDETKMTVHKREVKPGNITPRGIMLTGLEPGEWIATAGVHYLKEGQQVRIMGQETKEATP